jgi:UDP-GlcNAc:undecaprenyl-phosphate GlcNAc-1-phosphate transferase
MEMLLLTIAVALTTSVIVTPVVRRVSHSLGILDSPDGLRKLHLRPIPLGGGVAVFLAVGISIVSAVHADRGRGGGLFPDLTFPLWLLCSTLILCTVGLIDDRWQLRGRQKLAGQILAVGILMFSGLRIDSVQIFNWNLEFGTFAVPFTMLWLLGAINALNLIDGSDGVATTVGIVLSLTLMALATLTGHATDAILAASLLGALIGFLIYNFPPASVFLGDAGSMLIGLLLGVLAIRSALKGPATVALAAPSALWAIPLFDVSMAILRRKLTGRSIYDTDRGHLHHCLQQRGYSGRKIVFFVGFLCACTASGAIASVYRHSELMALASAMAVIGTLIATRCFGHSECSLLLQQSKLLIQSLIRRGSKPHAASQQLTTHLNGRREWNELWQTLVNYAERSEICAVRLNVSLPSIHDEFHATWDRRRDGDENQNEQWSTAWPLQLHGVTVGRLEISGRCHCESVSQFLGDLLYGLTYFEGQLLSLLENPPCDQVSAVKASSGVQPVLYPGRVPEEPAGARAASQEWPRDGFKSDTSPQQVMDSRKMTTLTIPAQSAG